MRPARAEPAGAGRPAGAGSDDRDDLLRVAIVSAYTPLPHGSAMFAAELYGALASGVPRWRVGVCAVGPRHAPYAGPVTMVIDNDRRTDYRKGGRALAASGADLVVVQHDAGVLGGPDGSYLLDLVGELDEAAVPYAVMLHTVPASQRADQRQILTNLCNRAARVVAFTDQARRLLHLSGIAPAHRTAVLRPGAPWQLRRPFHPGDLRAPVVRALRSVRDARLLTTLGQYGPDGGLDFAIAALRDIADRHPTAVLLVVRPAAVDRDDERSRRTLGALARRLDVAERLRYLDLVLTPAELTAVLARTDVFLSPYQNCERDRSGPLTYALAAGCPVVATSYRYAVEMCTNDDGPAPGLIVPCGSIAALSDAVDRLLGSRADLAAAQAGADLLGDQLTWDRLVPSYVKLLTDAARTAGAGTRDGSTRRGKARVTRPRINHDHAAPRDEPVR